MILETKTARENVTAHKLFIGKTKGCKRNLPDNGNVISKHVAEWGANKIMEKIFDE